MILKFIFWFLVLLVIHTYFLYPLILLIISSLIRKDLKIFTYNFYPKVSLIIPVYNERFVIEDKIRNSLELDYPKERLEIIIVDDGSTDRTAEIVSKYKQVKLIKIFEREGKINAINTAVPIADGSIILFSDASTSYNKDVISRIINHFADLKVGCVTGCVELIPRGGSHVSGEGFYSRYEQFIKTKESEISSVIGIDSALYAIRKELYRPLKNLVIENFVMGMNIIKYGYKVVYDRNISGWEYKSPSIREEIKRKSIAVAGGFQCLPKLLFLLKKPIILFQFISHKMLRWIAPEILIAILAVNWFLLDSSFYQNLFVLQLLFYIFSPLGVLMSSLRLFSIPYYFFVINSSAFLGFLKYLIGTQDN